MAFIRLLPPYPLALSLLAAASLAGCSSPSTPAADRPAGTIPANSPAAHVPAAAPAGSPLEVIAQFPDPQMVGVAVVPGGKIFAVFPRWDYNPPVPVGVVGPNSTLTPYPNASWCTWNDSVRNEPQKHWICPQSVFADAQGSLWVLDPAAPGLKFIVPGGPKLVKTDPKTGAVLQNISFPLDVAPLNSYLNDVRIDLEHNYAYLTESGVGALVVVDLKTGKPRRLLSKHPSMLMVKGFVTKAQGHALFDPLGKPAKFNVDGIALSTDNQYLYYRALSGHQLFRIKTAALRDAALTDAQLATQIENLGEAPASDGMELDSQNNLYLTGFENGEILRRTPAGKMETVVKEARLEWPDTFAWDPDGQHIYFATSGIHKVPYWNKGVGQPREPFTIYRMALKR